MLFRNDQIIKNISGKVLDEKNDDLKNQFMAGRYRYI